MLPKAFRCPCLDSLRVGPVSGGDDVPQQRSMDVWT